MPAVRSRKRHDDVVPLVLRDVYLCVAQLDHCVLVPLPQIDSVRLNRQREEFLLALIGARRILRRPHNRLRLILGGGRIGRISTLKETLQVKLNEKPASQIYTTSIGESSTSVNSRSRMKRANVSLATRIVEKLAIRCNGIESSKVEPMTLTLSGILIG